jgi:hypothetical protein
VPIAYLPRSFTPQLRISRGVSARHATTRRRVVTTADGRHR